VSEVMLGWTGLDKIQAAWPAGKPLSLLTDADCQRAIETVSDKVIRHLNPDVPDYRRLELKIEVSRVVGSEVVVGEEIALGDFSIMYKGNWRGRSAVVKAALPSIRLDWIAGDFKSRADWFRDYGNHPFIKIFDTVSNDRISCAIMEYVPLPTLREVHGLKPREVANVLAQVTQATHSLHQKAKEEDSQTVRLVGPLRPGHIFYDSKDGTIKIAPLGMSSATLQSGDSRPLLTLSESEMPSLTPERYAGERFRFETDQYYIGLLGLELLTGAPPITVECYADLKKKDAFFDKPMAKFQEYREDSPELFFVLARMLERQPENRWSSMLEVHEAFSRIVQGKLPEDLRNNAIEVYNNINHSTFYDDFYQLFFDRSPGAREFFKDTDWALQHQKLKQAVGVLLNFRPEDFQNISMATYAEQHGKLGIHEEYFIAFRDAFIETLLKTGVDSYGIDAWRAVLNAGIRYMTRQEAP
jgi:serine/threonine protein kinase